MGENNIPPPPALFTTRPYPSSPPIPIPTNRRNYWSVVFFIAWLGICLAAFVSSLTEQRQSLSFFLLLGSVPLLIALWFTLQSAILSHFIRELSIEKWAHEASVPGLLLGISAGFTLGGYGLAFLARVPQNILSYELQIAGMLAFAGSGLLVGFAILGWFQSRALGPFLSGTVWWVGAMSVAWVPAVLVYLLYGLVVGQLSINIYPLPHSVVQVFAAEVALLCPSLATFVLFLRRARSRSGIENDIVPLALRAALLTPPLVVALLFVGLSVSQALRVERAWVVKDYAGYLDIDGQGQVLTAPPSGDVSAVVKWRLTDTSPDGSLLAKAEGDHISIYSAQCQTDCSPIRTIRVFPGPPPESWYADDVINIVRFSPDGTMLAAGTGQALDFDSAVNPSYDHSVHIWSVADGKSLYTLSDPPYGVYALAWSPSGSYIAAGGGLERDNGLSYPDQVIRIWQIDGSSGQPSLHSTLQGHTSKIIALTWYPNGDRLVSADGQHRVVVWRAP